mgnify:FL=1
MKTWSLSCAKHVLRGHGMREAYTQGGAIILYCGPTAFRIINDYTLESWNCYETNSGTITHYDTHNQLCTALVSMGLESLGRI